LENYLRHTTVRITGEEFINAGEIQEYENRSAFSENVTSEKKDLALGAHSRAAKRMRGKSTLNYEEEEETLRFEKRKLERLIKQGLEDENLNFFRSLMPYVKLLLLTKMLFLSLQFQNVVADQTAPLQNNLLHA
jgi:hypothetical protein